MCFGTKITKPVAVSVSSLKKLSRAITSQHIQFFTVQQPIACVVGLLPLQHQFAPYGIFPGV